MKKKLLLGILLVLCAPILIVYFRHRHGSAPENNTQSSTAQPTSSEPTNPSFNKSRYSTSTTDSIWLIVNKGRPLPENFEKPSDLRKVNAPYKPGKPDEEHMLRSIAAQNLELLLADAKTAGFPLMIGSGFRSKSLQTTYYENYVKSYGQGKADTFSARPGKSEHQTGLAVDVATVDGKCYLDICFGDSAAGQWVAEHAHEYGFIIRYPKGKETVTQYQYEPWHLRYVGKDLALQLYNSAQTMEEFFGY